MMTIMQNETSGRTQAQKRLLERYGPWAVVTGASDGIGRAFAAELAAAGLNVVLVARRAEALEAVALQLRALGAEARVVAADLSRPEGVAATLEATQGLSVGLLVAAAGFGTSGPFVDAPLQDELQMLDVNCRAVVAMAHHFGARFAQQRRGGLVLLSSLLAFQGVPRAAHYAATKAFIQTFAEGLRLELGPRGVDVLASAPGPVHSGFAQRASMQMGLAARPDEVATASLSALGRRGTVRPGWLSKLLEASLAILPRWGRTRVMAVVMGSMTRAH
jgi:hypothetical protein